jgi:hypothetical protein
MRDMAASCRREQKQAVFLFLKQAQYQQNAMY